MATGAPNPAPTRVLAIRHGESEWNVLGRWQGRADTALSDQGRRQAQAAAWVLGSFDGIWSSDLQRAAETAAIIAADLGVGPVMVDPRLGETHVGPWEGLTHEEIEAGWPGYISEHRRPPDAEPLADVAVRASASLVDIAATTPGGELLVVTHAGVLRTLCYSLGERPHRYPNLGGRWFDVHDDGRIAAGSIVELIEPSTTVNDAL
jgi:broad specificity phosphatase PhoE